MFAYRQGASCRHPWIKTPQYTPLARNPQTLFASQTQQEQVAYIPTWQLPWVKGLHQRETATAITDGVAVTPQPRADGDRAPGSSQAKGSSRGAAVAAPLLLGAPAHRKCKPTALYPAPTGVNSCTVCTETCSWDLEVEESYCSEGKEVKGKEKTATSAWPGTTELLPGPGEGMPPGLSSPSQSTPLWISLLPQQIAFRMDSKKRHQRLYRLLFVWGLYLVWGQYGGTHEVTCRKANITMTWAAAAGVVERQSAEMETWMRRAEKWRV